MRFSFISCERDESTITALCLAIQVARSGYHAWVERKECERAKENRVLAVHVAAAFERSRRTYGSPRIQADLRDDGVRIGRSRTARIVRENGLCARRKKAFRVAQRSCGREHAAPNSLDRKFRARNPNRKWVTDVKYIHTNADRLYLAPVIDLFSRRVVGCAMSTEQDGKPRAAALASAVEARNPSKGIMIHSDRGGIYRDEEYLDTLDKIGIKRSMSRTSNPWDSAVIESFFSTLHFELLSRTRFENQEDAQPSITEWINNFYNSQRRHTTIGNTSPIKYELACQMRKRRT